ncbi:hypothetical protein [Myxococcus sp. AM010]|uniref:hypothetical protein n=1 Tax=Myxococcus sp. AM010 TaxID=2745138 RepID=UPI0015956501|nr:hypothetical protein [Myxococcus sp. AM010]NVJ15323.1 hypothetical protein [Myxococcus sp. AM010]
MEHEREETAEELEARALAQVPTDASGDTITVDGLRRRLAVGKEKVQTMVNRLLEAGLVVRLPNRGLQRTGRSSLAEDSTGLAVAST